MKHFRKFCLTMLAAALAVLLALGRAPAYAAPSAAKPTFTIQVAPTNGVATSTAVTNASLVARNGWYYDRERVAAYIVAYGCLPGNFITKGQARQLGWQGGPVEPYAPGKVIGGDRFGNYERRLPQGNWRECDIDTKGRARGARRIIFSNDRRIYYTADHYQTFKRIH